VANPRFEVNLSILFTELPLLERPAAARQAGFDAVEFWWPWAVAVPSDAEIDRFAAANGLSRGEGDVLLTLRRAGPPYRLRPSDLARAQLVTPGGITSRLDRLEHAGLVRRRPDPGDRRVIEVELTPKARRLIDALLPAHVENEERLLAGLSKRDRHELDRLLGKLLATLEG